MMSKCRSKNSSQVSLTVGIVIEDMERVIFLIFRIDPVAGKPAAQAVGTVMHRGDGAG